MVSLSPCGNVSKVVCSPLIPSLLSDSPFYLYCDLSVQFDCPRGIAPLRLCGLYNLLLIKEELFNIATICE